MNVYLCVFMCAFTYKDIYIYECAWLIVYVQKFTCS